MKLTAAELKRLMELMSKSATTLTEAEKTELSGLQAKANASTDDDDSGMTADDVKKTVEDAVKAALPQGTTVTADNVKSIVADALKDFKPGATVDAEDIATKVKAAMPATITSDDVKGIVTAALKGFRKDSKMAHPDDDETTIDMPISHRSGNLAVDAKQLLNVMMKGADFINDGISESILKDAEKRGQVGEKRLMNRLRQGGVHAQKAITTTGAGTGAEFMNSTLSSTLLSRMYLESELAAALAASEVQMPTNPYTYPLGTTLPEFKTGGELEDAEDTEFGTDGLTFNAKKLIGRVPYSYEADEDSIIAILPKILKDMGEASAMALENAMINGDNAATHQDSDIHAVSKHAAKLFDGMRKLALAQADLKLSLATGGISAINVGALKKLLKRWGLKPKDLLIVAGVSGYNDFVMLPETLTADKAGDKASARIYTGLAPNLLGMDIIASAAMREDLNASGVYDGTTTTKGSFMIIHKPSWMPAVRRGFMIEQDKDISLQKKFVVGSFRRDFKPMEGLDKVKIAAIGYNYESV